MALEAEDQGHVDADTSTDSRGDRLETLDGRGDLDERVLAVDLLPELLSLSDRARSVVSKSRLDLDRDAAVEAGSRIVDRAEDVAGRRDIIGGDLEDCVGDRSAGLRQSSHRGVVRLTLRECASEDGRVGRDADDIALGDQLLQSARGDAFTGEVVEPDADSEGGQGCGGGFGAHCFFFLRAAYWAANDSLAAATAASVVIPNSRNRVL